MKIVAQNRWLAKSTGLWTWCCFEAIGLDLGAMERGTAGHQGFLGWLGLPVERVAAIRCGK